MEREPVTPTTEETERRPPGEADAAARPSPRGRPEDEEEIPPEGM